MREIRATVREGESLLAALYRAGEYVEASCGGHGRCRRCRVRILAGPPAPPGPEDAEHLAPGERETGWRLACRVEGPGDYRLTAARPLPCPEPDVPAGPATGRPAAVAFDLGTTTLAAALVDRETGEVRARAARPNPQAAYGADVLARAGWARDPEHRARLADLVRRGLRDVLARVLRAVDRTAADVDGAALAGNASMTTLFLARDPAALLVPPYEPGLAAEGRIAADPASLELPAAAPARFLPALGGHVGSDTTAAILAARLPDGPLPALLVDLGTNGEVALATANGILVTSSAAGPAFEGGGIEHGSAAGPGAIDAIRTDGGRFVWRTVAGAPRTWCGSGVVDLVAALVETGAVDRTGRLVAAPDLPVPFSAGDVREFQLAKGAVGAAIRILAREAGVAVDGLRRVVLTGAFGARMRAGPARRIGLVPAGPPVEAMDDGALAGAVLALAEGGFERTAAIAARARHVPLGDHPGFEETFVASLALEELLP